MTRQDASEWPFEGLNADACVFCRIVSGEEWAAKVWEDDEHVAFMDRYPASIGHTLVATKRHYRDIFEMREEEVSRLYGFVARVAKAVKQALNPDGVNILQNNGSAAGQIIFHIHVHIIPRSASEASFFRGRWRRKRASEEELLALAQSIEGKIRELG